MSGTLRDRRCDSFRGLVRPLAQANAAFRGTGQGNNTLPTVPCLAPYWTYGTR